MSLKIALRHGYTVFRTHWRVTSRARGYARMSISNVSLSAVMTLVLSYSMSHRVLDIREECVPASTAEKDV
jgi:hypothetical protein